MNATNLQSDIDETVAQSAAAKLLHPEDISVGDNVALAIQSYNYPSFFWCMADPAIMPPDETVRLSFLPTGTSKPFKVVAVCLPFVLCEKVDGKYQTFDVRRVQLMRLAPEFAELARMGYANKKRKKVLAAEKFERQKSVVSASEPADSQRADTPSTDSFVLSDGVAFEEPIAGNKSAEVVLFEFTVQVPFTDPEDVGGFFSVVVRQS